LNRTALPQIGVAALQGDVAEHVRAVRAVGGAPREVRRPADLEGLAGLIIPGGESTTIGRLMVEYGLDEAIVSRHHEGMAVFGTCAGLILLARDIVGSHQPRLGLMDLSVRRNAFGRQRESFEALLDVPAIGADPLTAVFIRAPYIERVGPEAEELAAVNGRPVLARQGRCLAAAFHPELTDDPRLHAYFLQLARSG
jgi:5'-phosphate synthase pdxT subunit